MEEDAKREDLWDLPSYKKMVDFTYACKINLRDMQFDKTELYKALCKSEIEGNIPV